MCRHLGYVGPPVALAELLIDPPHSLLRQSWAPTDMRGGGTINADGFGFGWYASGRSDAATYRRSAAMWTDGSLPALARTIVSGCVLAAVRSATVGMPVTETAVAPFAEGRWLFSHNGLVTGWPDSVEALAAELPTRDLMTLEAPIDSALLWALVRHRLRGGASPAAALSTVTRAVARAAPGSRLNLLLVDGEAVTATIWGHALSVRESADQVAVSSEPWDRYDSTWQPIPDRHLVTARPGSVQLHPIGDKELR